MKIKCPNCGLEQDKANLFCSECGTKLVEDTGVPTMAFDPAFTGGSVTNRLEGVPQPPTKPLAGARLNLHIIRTGEILPIGGEGEYIVGRVSSGQSILPDVDLEPFHGYSAGVSRLHARIKVEPKAMWITDLGSANGTRVNNQKLTPHKDHPLSNKDVIRLGRFSLQALVGEE
ncbi:MAG: FHA domain-containing protein [Anaerolineales bacterium]